MGVLQRVRDRVQARREKIVVTYEPCRDGDADPGEVVWGWVPYEEDATQGKDRPVVVIGRWGADLACVPLTSKDRPGDPDRLPIGTGAWDPDLRPSWVCVDRLLRFGPSSVRREGCAIEEGKFRTVVDAVRARHRTGSRRARGRS